MNEDKFIEVYRDVSGGTEASARSAYMFNRANRDANPSNTKDPSTADPEAKKLNCSVCQKLVTETNWFCRIPSKPNPIILCSPECATRYFEMNSPKKDGQPAAEDDGNQSAPIDLTGR